MMDMSIHDVSGVVGWCLGAYSEVENTYVHHLHTFLHTGSGLYNPLQHPQCVSRPHILYNISTTLYNTLQSTALQQFYSLQPLQHPSGSSFVGSVGEISIRRSQGVPFILLQDLTVQIYFLGFAHMTSVLTENPPSYGEGFPVLRDGRRDGGFS